MVNHLFLDKGFILDKLWIIPMEFFSQSLSFNQSAENDIF